MKIDRVRTYPKGCPSPMLWGQLFIAYGITPFLAVIILLWCDFDVDWLFAVPAMVCCAGVIAVGIKLWMLDAEWVAYHWPKQNGLMKKDMVDAVRALNSRVSTNSIVVGGQIYLCSNGVVHWPNGAMHPYSFKDLMGEEAYNDLLSRERVLCTCGE